MKTKTFMVALVFAMIAVQGCGTAPVRNPAPLEQQQRAEVVDMPGVRAWGDAPSEAFHADLVQSVRDENPTWFHRGADGAFEGAG